jgi:hypothetical protein
MPELEMLAGPLPGVYHLNRSGKVLFAFFAAMAEIGQENSRKSMLEGLDISPHKGKHDGQPPLITDDMLHAVLRRSANGESVEQAVRGHCPHGSRGGGVGSVLLVVVERDNWCLSIRHRRLCLDGACGLHCSW